MRSGDRETIAKRVLAISQADETEVLVASSDTSLTRFTRNGIHQNVAARDVAVSVRAIAGKRTGVAATNRVDESSLRDVAERALAMARLAPEDPDFVALPKGEAAAPPPGSYSEATASASPALRATMTDTIFRIAEADGLWSAGYCSTGVSGYTIASSAGTLASFDGTEAGINVKMNGADSTGFAECYVNDVAGLDAHAIGAKAAAIARETAQPRAVEPGSWTVILEPAAFGELLSYLADHFSARAFDEGSSFYSGKLGETLLGSNVTIVDDYAQPLAPSSPYDYEGQRKERVTLIEQGVARDIVTDSYWAHKLQRRNTGHALPAPNSYGPQALNLLVMPGSKSTGELIASTQRGLLVTRFWYIRTVDQKHAIVTGMTRDGTFLIENGTIAGGVRNMRFNQSILGALRACEFSRDLRRTGGYSYSCVVPSAKIENFTFTSATEF